MNIYFWHRTMKMSITATSSNTLTSWLVTRWSRGFTDCRGLFLGLSFFFGLLRIHVGTLQISRRPNKSLKLNYTRFVFKTLSKTSHSPSNFNNFKTNSPMIILMIMMHDYFKLAYYHIQLPMVTTWKFSSKWYSKCKLIEVEAFKISKGYTIT